MKTEYRTAGGAIEAYIASSGEFFWGDQPQTVESQAQQVVTPLEAARDMGSRAPQGAGCDPGRDNPPPSQPLREAVGREEFERRFIEKMVAVAGETFADGESVCEYAAQAAPTYWEEPWQREEGPEACALADINYWEG
ncbi:hypothetical protein [Phenylobacterium deserti]|uniref:hypothetical protein n=1 Tax=Phenylobacterium deserti TaxID=1914756 RepID=UPI0010582481|nr:hypothetical protein [Phenylobacterium deserti]